MLLFQIELDDASVWDHNIAPILKAPGVVVAPLARHHTLEEAPAIVKFATKDVYQVVNAAPALRHEPLKVFEGYFVVAHHILTTAHCRRSSRSIRRSATASFVKRP